MNPFRMQPAVITGAASGFGLVFARQAAAWGMKVVMADVEEGALSAARQEIAALGVETLAVPTDVSQADQVQALADQTVAAFGPPALLFNNAGVAVGGLIWENSERDWAWVLGVNLMGVAHGVRVFTPLMLRAAASQPGWRGHMVNTASMAGLLAAPNMGVYNASKHAVVALTETLYQDLALVTEQVSCSVLCPYFVPTGIHQSERNRPQSLENPGQLTRSQMISQAMSSKAVTHGKVTAEQVGQAVFDAIEQRRFYVYSHPQALAGVQLRLEDIMMPRNPTDPFAARPDIGQSLRAQLRAGAA